MAGVGRTRRPRVVKVETDCWWVMGDANGSFVHWKGDGILGCYVQTGDVEDAEIFDTKDEAMREIASACVQNDLDWVGGEIVPLRVEKRIEVSADA